MEKEKTGKIYYGWWIVIACMIVQAVPFGIAKNTISQFVSYVCEGENFTLAEFGTVFTVGVIVSAAVSPFIGRLFDNPKINKKLLYGIGAILSGGGFALYSVCHSLPAFYGVSAIMETGVAVISAIGVPVLINAWFQEKKGLALGLAFSGGGIGNIVLQQITPRLLDARGYEYTYWFLGMISLVIAVPVAFILIKFPETVEQRESRQREKAEKEREQGVKQEVPISQKENAVEENWGYSLKELFHRIAFWIFAIAWIAVGLYVAGMSVQFIVYFRALGFTTAMLANVGSVFAVFAIFGNLGGGIIFAKLGDIKSIWIAFIALLICCASLFLTPYAAWFGFLYAVMLGLSNYLYIIGPSYLCATLFGNRIYGTIVGVVNIFFAMGYAIGSVLFGVFAKNGEDYGGGWIYITVCVVIAYLFLLIATAYFKKLRKRGLEEDGTGREAH